MMRRGVWVLIAAAFVSGTLCVVIGAGIYDKIQPVGYKNIFRIEAMSKGQVAGMLFKAGVLPVARSQAPRTAFIAAQLSKKEPEAIADAYETTVAKPAAIAVGATLLTKSDKVVTGEGASGVKKSYTLVSADGIAKGTSAFQVTKSAAGGLIATEQTRADGSRVTGVYSAAIGKRPALTNAAFARSTDAGQVLTAQAFGSDLKPINTTTVGISPIISSEDPTRVAGSRFEVAQTDQTGAARIQKTAFEMKPRGDGSAVIVIDEGGLSLPAPKGAVKAGEKGVLAGAGPISVDVTEGRVKLAKAAAGQRLPTAGAPFDSIIVPRGGGKEMPQDGGWAIALAPMAAKGVAGQARVQRAEGRQAVFDTGGLRMPSPVETPARQGGQTVAAPAPPEVASSSSAPSSGLSAAERQSQITMETIRGTQMTGGMAAQAERLGTLRDLNIVVRAAFDPFFRAGPTANLFNIASGHQVLSANPQGAMEELAYRSSLFIDSLRPGQVEVLARAAGAVGMPDEAAALWQAVASGKSGRELLQRDPQALVRAMVAFRNWELGRASEMIALEASGGAGRMTGQGSLARHASRGEPAQVREPEKGGGKAPAVDTKADKKAKRLMNASREVQRQYVRKAEADARREAKHRQKAAERIIHRRHLDPDSEKQEMARISGEAAQTSKEIQKDFADMKYFFHLAPKVTRETVWLDKSGNIVKAPDYLPFTLETEEDWASRMNLTKRTQTTRTFHDPKTGITRSYSYGPGGSRGLDVYDKEGQRRLFLSRNAAGDEESWRWNAEGKFVKQETRKNGARMSGVDPVSLGAAISLAGEGIPAAYVQTNRAGDKIYLDKDFKPIGMQRAVTRKEKKPEAGEKQPAVGQPAAGKEVPNVGDLYRGGTVVGWATDKDKAGNEYVSAVTVKMPDGTYQVVPAPSVSGGGGRAIKFGDMWGKGFWPGVKDISLGDAPGRPVRNPYEGGTVKGWATDKDKEGKEYLKNVFIEMPDGSRHVVPPSSLPGGGKRIPKVGEKVSARSGGGPVSPAAGGGLNVASVGAPPTPPPEAGGVAGGAPAVAVPVVVTRHGNTEVSTWTDPVTGVEITEARTPIDPDNPAIEMTIKREKFLDGSVRTSKDLDGDGKTDEELTTRGSPNGSYTTERRTGLGDADPTNDTTTRTDTFWEGGYLTVVHTEDGSHDKATARWADGTMHEAEDTDGDGDFNDENWVTVAAVPPAGWGAEYPTHPKTAASASDLLGGGGEGKPREEGGTSRPPTREELDEIAKKLTDPIAGALAPFWNITRVVGDSRTGGVYFYDSDNMLVASKNPDGTYTAIDKGTATTLKDGGMVYRFKRFTQAEHDAFAKKTGDDTVWYEIWTNGNTWHYAEDPRKGSQPKWRNDHRYAMDPVTPSDREDVKQYYGQGQANRIVTRFDLYDIAGRTWTGYFDNERKLVVSKDANGNYTEWDPDGSAVRVKDGAGMIIWAKGALPFDTALVNAQIADANREKHGVARRDDVTYWYKEYSVWVPLFGGIQSSNERPGDEGTIRAIRLRTHSRAHEPAFGSYEADGPAFWRVFDKKTGKTRDFVVRADLEYVDFLPYVLGGGADPSNPAATSPVVEITGLDLEAAAKRVHDHAEYMRRSKEGEKWLRYNEYFEAAISLLGAAAGAIKAGSVNPTKAGQAVGPGSLPPGFGPPGGRELTLAEIAERQALEAMKPPPLEEPTAPREPHSLERPAVWPPSAPREGAEGDWGTEQTEREQELDRLTEETISSLKAEFSRLEILTFGRKFPAGWYIKEMPKLLENSRAYLEERGAVIDEENNVIDPGENDPVVIEAFEVAIELLRWAETQGKKQEPQRILEDIKAKLASHGVEFMPTPDGEEPLYFGASDSPVGRLVEMFFEAKLRLALIQLQDEVARLRSQLEQEGGVFELPDGRLAATDATNKETAARVDRVNDLLMKIEGIQKRLQNATSGGFDINIADVWPEAGAHSVVNDFIRDVLLRRARQQGQEGGRALPDMEIDGLKVFFIEGLSATGQSGHAGIRDGHLYIDADVYREEMKRYGFSPTLLHEKTELEAWHRALENRGVARSQARDWILDPANAEDVARIQQRAHAEAAGAEEEARQGGRERRGPGLARAPPDSPLWGRIGGIVSNIMRAMTGRAPERSILATLSPEQMSAENELGRGASGVVYRVTLEIGGRRVDAAVKFTNSTQQIERDLEAIQALVDAGLAEKLGLPTVYGMVRGPNGEIGYAMERIDGAHVGGERDAEAASYITPETYTTLRRVVDALTAAGIVVNDFQGMITRDGKFRLIDPLGVRKEGSLEGLEGRLTAERIREINEARHESFRDYLRRLEGQYQFQGSEQR